VHESRVSTAGACTRQTPRAAPPCPALGPPRAPPPASATPHTPPPQNTHTHTHLSPRQESDLFPFFQQFGTILELALLRQPDGRHRGCGFLTYASQAEAEAAIASANGVVMPNDTRQRPMTVKYATSRAMGPAMPPGAL
jgi:hypothetical protein